MQKSSEPVFVRSLAARSISGDVSTPTTDAWYLFRNDLAVAPVPVPRSTQFVTGGAPTMARAASTTSQAALRVSRPPYAKASRPAVNLCE